VRSGLVVGRHQAGGCGSLFVDPGNFLTRLTPSLRTASGLEHRESIGIARPTAVERVAGGIARLSATGVEADALWNGLVPGQIHQQRRCRPPCMAKAGCPPGGDGRGSKTTRQCSGFRNHRGAHRRPPM